MVVAAVRLRSLKLQVFMRWSRITLAQIDAAETMAKSESAFFDTVIFAPVNSASSLRWYFSGGPTVST